MWCDRVTHYSWGLHHTLEVNRLLGTEKRYYAPITVSKYTHTQSDETETKGRNSREKKEMEDQGSRKERREEKQWEEEKVEEEGRGRGGKKKIKLWDLCLQNGQFVKQLRASWEVCDRHKWAATAGTAGTGAHLPSVSPSTEPRQVKCQLIVWLCFSCSCEGLWHKAQVANSLLSLSYLPKNTSQFN